MGPPPRARLSNKPAIAGLAAASESASRRRIIPLEEEAGAVEPGPNKAPRGSPRQTRPRRPKNQSARRYRGLAHQHLFGASQPPTAALIIGAPHKAVLARGSLVGPRPPSLCEAPTPLNSRGPSLRAAQLRPRPFLLSFCGLCGVWSIRFSAAAARLSVSSGE